MVTPTLAPAIVRPGRRIYAVGDVHGCLDRLTALHEAIATDLAARPVDETLLIHVGDFIDRGPDSAGVIERLLHPILGLERVRVVNLMGNHEAMFLDALGGSARAAETWLGNGGPATLASWGVPMSAPPGEWAAQMPPAHLQFISGLELSHTEGDYFFVHAGIRPGVPLAQQRISDLLWIREPFLSWSDALPCVVVHGHTPGPLPVVRPNRIGIDTGAVMGGRLTCVALEADTLAFLVA